MALSLALGAGAAVVVCAVADEVLSADALSNYESVPEIHGLRIPGGGTRSKNEIAYTYGPVREGSFGRFMKALRGSVTDNGWTFERNTKMQGSVVFDCTKDGQRVGVLITRDTAGRIVLTLTPAG
jgi:hypothetical protein